MADETDAALVLTRWARAMRQRDHGDASRPSVFGRLHVERVAAGAPGAPRQRVVEGLQGEALLAHRTLFNAPEPIRAVVAAEYLSDLPAAGRARALKMSRSGYYRALRCSLMYVAGALDRIEHEGAAGR